MILTTTSQKIEAVLAGAVSANQPQFVVSYADITSSAFTPGSNNGDLNGTTDVDLVTAPGSSTYRQVKHLSIYNADTAAVTVTVNLDDSGTDRKLIETTLPAGSVLSWSPETGWVKGVSGSHSFIDLPDTPSSYSGNAGKIAVVNSAEDALKFVGFRGALVSLSSNQSISNSTYTAIEWDNLAYDLGGWLDIGGTNPERLTVPSGVSYVQIQSNIVFDGSTASSPDLRAVGIWKNGSNAIGLPLFIEDAGWYNSNYFLSITSGVITVTGGDYFEIRVRQDSGGALDVISLNRTYVSIQEIK